MVEPQIVAQGDKWGNDMVIKYPLPNGRSVYGMGLALTWASRLGPTWVWLVEADRLTLVDAGCLDTVSYLRDRLKLIGYRIRDIQRVILTHGHVDHDGNTYDIVKRSGAEVWAHEIYKSFLNIDYFEWEQRFHEKFLRGRRAASASTGTGTGPFAEDYRRRHAELRSKLVLGRALHDGDEFDGWRFYYTPGHTPEETCIRYGDYLFTGDHILPQITPHPSVRLRHRHYKEVLPLEYREENKSFGLLTYLRSLRKVCALGEGFTLMPAHRVYYHEKFNPITMHRAEEIIRHHIRRLNALIELLCEAPLTVEELTRRHFRGTDLSGNYFYQALDEVIGHLELLYESGDIVWLPAEPPLIECKGTKNYLTLIEGLSAT